MEDAVDVLYGLWCKPLFAQAVVIALDWRLVFGSASSMGGILHQCQSRGIPHEGHSLPVRPG